MVEISKISAFGNKQLVEGIGLQSGRRVRRPMTNVELRQLRRIRGTDHTFAGDPDQFLLGVEAERIRIAHQFDPLFAVNSSIVDPLPHQVDAVYRYLLPLPRIRFLLADDTGAGKTIMTGLLLKELLFRGVIEKILIITPGGLTKQWQEEELQEKFGLHARLVNYGSFAADPAQFARNGEGIFVASIDFLARNEQCLRAVAETQWDMIVVDEAHKLSAYEYGAKLDESDRYKAVKALVNRTDHLLFLTATPHRGRKDSFRRLLMLLDEDLFQKDEYVEARIRATTGAAETFEAETSITRARNRFFLRRLKEEMRDWDGAPLFKDRHTITPSWELTPEEKRLYDEVTNYVRSKRKEAKQKRNRNVELTLMVMQRRLTSSIYAITRTLENRLKALNGVLRILQDPTKSAAEKKRLLGGGPDPDDPRDINEYEERDDEERARIDDKIFRQVLTDDPAKVEQERNEIERLWRMAHGLRDHTEAKFAELLKVLDASDVIRAEDEKLLIFTEHKDTLKSLRDRLEGKGYSVVTIDGSMDVDARKHAQREFRNRAKIMVATDAAGEGINLQFCRFLINWDIPWNPNRLEQRMGRVHRYGQKDDVYVYNMVAENTLEGGVLKRVLEKMEVMREQLGSDRIYDVIGDLMEDVPLVQLIEDAIDANDAEHARRETTQLLDKVTSKKAEELVSLQKKKSLASKPDLLAAKELRDASDEKRLQPLFIQRFFERAWAACGGSMEKDATYPVWRIGPTPQALLEIARQLRRPVSDHYEQPIVFDKALVSVASRTRVPDRTRLMGPGHPLFDVLIEWTIRHAQHAFAAGAVLVDPNIARPQTAWLARSTIVDGRTENRTRIAHERLGVLVLDQLGLRVTSPSYFLNCVAPSSRIESPAVETESIDELQAWAYEQLTEKQLDHVKALRQEECDLRREYLTTAFTDLIVGLQAELSELQQGSLLGEENSEDRQRLETRIEALKARRQERMQELDLMLNLTANLPEVLTKALVVPAAAAIVEDGTEPTVGVPMQRDDEVEAIAMEVVMKFERSRGWTPHDVHLDGEHYDIRSESPQGEKRFIEVKGRAKSGPVIMTEPELNRLRQLGQRAWLYVVTHCRGSLPHLCLVQDPAARLHPAMLYRQVQFLVEEKDWSSAGSVAQLEQGVMR